MAKCVAAKKASVVDAERVAKSSSSSGCLDLQALSKLSPRPELKVEVNPKVAMDGMMSSIFTIINGLFKTGKMPSDMSFLLKAPLKAVSVGASVRGVKPTSFSEESFDFSSSMNVTCAEAMVPQPPQLVQNLLSQRAHGLMWGQ